MPLHASRLMVAAATSLLFLPAAAGSSILQTLALTGDPAPGGPTGAVFLETGLPDLNNAGQVAFAAAMEPGVGGVTEADALGLWVGAPGQTPAPRVVGAAPASGIPGAFFQQIATAPSITDDGSIIAEYILEVGPGDVTFNNDWGRWSFSPGGDSILYREGDAPPGVDPAAEIDLAFGLNNLAGDVFLRATLRVGPGGVTGTNSAVLWKRLADGTTQFLARSGFSAPGAPVGTFFQNVSTTDLNDSGTVASRNSFLQGFAGVDDTNDGAIYSDRSGAYTLEYREGDLLPGGVVLADLGGVQINNQDRLAFSTELPIEPGGIPFPDEILWIETDNGLEEAFRTGLPGPGTGSRSVRNFGDVQWNDSGRLAFLGSDLTGRPEWLFSNGPTGDLQLIAEEGGAAPGVPSGTVFDSDLSTRFFGSEITLNEAGQVAFTSALVGAGVDETNDTGVWAQDLSGVLRLIVRDGDTITVAPGDDRIVTDWAFGGFNDSGQVAFNASFTDGTFGVFLSDAATRFAGDYNADGRVDAADYTVWRDTDGQTGPGLAADGNGDNQVDAADLAVWRADFGRAVAGATTAVPEPTGVTLLALALSLAGVSRARPSRSSSRGSRPDRRHPSRGRRPTA